MDLNLSRWGFKTTEKNQKKSEPRKGGVTMIVSFGGPSVKSGKKRVVVSI